MSVDFALQGVLDGGRTKDILKSNLCTLLQIGRRKRNKKGAKRQENSRIVDRRFFVTGALHMDESEDAGGEPEPDQRPLGTS